MSILLSFFLMPIEYVIYLRSNINVKPLTNLSGQKFLCMKVPQHSKLCLFFSFQRLGEQPQYLSIDANILLGIDLGLYETKVINKTKKKQLGTCGWGLIKKKKWSARTSYYWRCTLMPSFFLNCMWLGKFLVGCNVQERLTLVGYGCTGKLRTEQQRC